MITSSSIHLPAYVIISFMHVYHIFIFHSLGDEHLVCFHSLAVVDGASTNEQVPL